MDVKSVVIAVYMFGGIQHPSDSDRTFRSWLLPKVLQIAEVLDVLLCKLNCIDGTLLNYSKSQPKLAHSRVWELDQNNRSLSTILIYPTGMIDLNRKPKEIQLMKIKMIESLDLREEFRKEGKEKCPAKRSREKSDHINKNDGLEDILEKKNSAIFDLEKIEIRTIEENLVLTYRKKHLGRLPILKQQIELNSHSISK
uniref:Uncharacterized protein n=1 Tax=Cucumis melo TaxID=3656 RepID=A0A9I9EB99_CUCME